jgi:hypothetical protein
LPLGPDSFSGEPFLVLVARRLPGIEHALRLVGGDGGEPPEDLRTVRGIVASHEGLAGLSAPDLERLRACDAPLFVFPERGGAARVDLRALLHGLGHEQLADLSTGEVRSIREYAFADDPWLWPFAGLRLSEDRPRELAPLAAEEGGIDPLVSCREGWCLVARARSGAARPPVLVSTIPLADDARAPRLGDCFRRSRFAALLPLLLFAKACLGDAAWQVPEPRAAFMVDDLTLRARRYGFLDYAQLVGSARADGFHTAIAMIPIDCGKTRRGAAELVRENPRQLSLLVHGVDHVRAEFERDVSPARAREVLAAGLRRMEWHERRTGVPFARAMTFPFGRCSEIWMEAMRATGFHAAIASRAFPFTPREQIREPLYEMHPAEMTFGGFPVANRFRAENEKEDLLFHAWLGKPLIVYTHHDFFRDGLERLTEIAGFLNRHVAPAWSDIGSILRSNYQLRRRNGVWQARVFSNVVALPASDVESVLKPCAPASERATVNGESRRLTELEAGAALGDLGGGPLRLAFGPAERAAPSRYRPPLWARARRLLTEARDQSAPLTRRLARR